MKACRLHKNGTDKISGWTNINNKLDNDAIKTIKDDLFSGNAAKVATSIPDPFARIYLIETAFKMVNSSGSPIGKSLYHKLVSDCLDMFQLLYNLGDSRKVKYLKWDKTFELGSLLNLHDVQVGGIPTKHPHKVLGEALEMALKSNRFSDFNEIYLIFYEGILIGGTSPLTVFYTSSNLAREFQENAIPFPTTTTNDLLFDDDPEALLQRAEDFKDYMYKFWVSNKSLLAANAPYLEEYIRTNGGDAYNNSLIHNNIDTNRVFDEFVPIFLDIKKTQSLFSGPIQIKQHNPQSIQIFIENNSGFVMRPTVDYFKKYRDKGIEIDLHTPLALAGPTMNYKIKYIHNQWDEAIQVDYQPYTDLHNRNLPGQNIVYPYLTTQDFLEDKLIKMPFNLNKDYFFTGYSGDFNYLLPIKKEYFNYFTIDDLRKNLSIESGTDNIRVELKIPVKDTTNNFIIFSKIYKTSGSDNDIWEEPSTGRINNFGVGVYPFYKVVDRADLNDYVVMTTDTFDEFSVSLAFFKYSDIINKRPLTADPITRSTKSSEGGKNMFYRISLNTDNSFDLIEVNLNGQNALIIPIFKEVSYNKNHEHFRFAVDFGTSNTHIAYTSGNDPNIRPFDIALTDLQMVLLSEPENDYEDINDRFTYGTIKFPELDSSVKRAFVPYVIGDRANIKYPIRTVTSESNSFSSSEMKIFGNINIGYYFDAESVGKLSNTIYNTNIKWGIENNPAGTDEKNRVFAYFIETLWLIKNKILMNNGSLDTEIVWFVPISMKRNARSSFSDLWKAAVVEIFGKNNQVKLMLETESTAPYYYLQSSLGFFSGEDAINIDIGGGTVDILFYAKSIDKYYSTSFKFGANTIWGDGITHRGGAASPKDNGFYQLLKNNINKGNIKIADNELLTIYRVFTSNPLYNSADIISFLFKYDNEFNFSSNIKNHQIRVLLFIHYSAILYHVSQILKWKKLSIPSYVTFTGKGSEYIKLIFMDNDELTEFTGKLLNKFTGENLPPIFNVVLAENPKEITSNGGLAKLQVEGEKINPEEVVHKGYVPDQVPEIDSENVEIRDVDKISQAVLENIGKFLDILSKDKDIKRFFSKSDLSMVINGVELKDIIEKYLDPTMRQVISDEIKRSNDKSDLIEETPFFWPLRDVFYRLSKELVLEKKK